MPTRNWALRAFMLAAMLPCGPAAAGDGAAEIALSGFAAFEPRLFFESPQFAGQDDTRLSPSLILAPEVVVEFGSGQDYVTAAPFLRLDLDDRERTHADLRTLDWVHREDTWDLRAGVSQITWGVVESRHLVDVINQVDAVEDLDEEDKLGQPLVNVNVDTGAGTVGLYYLPYFRERRFPAADARLSGGVPVLEDAAFDPGLGQWHPGGALRYAHTIDAVDLAVGHYAGLGREPRLVPTLEGGAPALRPRYELIHQTSLEAQVTLDALLLKLEAIRRSGQGAPFFAAVGGFEYTLFGIFESDADLGFLAEYLHDGRDPAPAAPATPFEDDIFLGTRLRLNDVEDTAIIAGAIIDRDTRATLLWLEAERRLGDRFKVELDGRWFAAVPDSDPLAPIRSDDHVMVRLSAYF